MSHMVDGRVVTGGEAGHLYIWDKARLVSTVKDVHPVSPLEGLMLLLTQERFFNLQCTSDVS